MSDKYFQLTNKLSSERQNQETKCYSGDEIYSGRFWRHMGSSHKLDKATKWLGDQGKSSRKKENGNPYLGIFRPVQKGRGWDHAT